MISRAVMSQDTDVVVYSVAIDCDKPINPLLLIHRRFWYSQGVSIHRHYKAASRSYWWDTKRIELLNNFDVHSHICDILLILHRHFETVTNAQQAANRALEQEMYNEHVYGGILGEFSMRSSKLPNIAGTTS